ncbi:MAG: hypothetical protein M3N31_01310, partial [Actinomycetota bacterium]|nr:hypothetical protein [Actinomycetota bacterium]
VLVVLDWRGLAAAVAGSLAFALGLAGAGRVLLPTETRRLLRRRRRDLRPEAVPAATAVMDPHEGPDPAEP